MEVKEEFVLQNDLLYIIFYTYIYSYLFTYLFEFIACEEPRVRFGDHCYEQVDSDISNILNNVYKCKEKNGELVIPQTSSEHHFISQTFQSTNNMYHLGVVSYKVMTNIYDI